MKNRNKTISLIVTGLSMIAICSCNRANELPPINDSLATEFILPDPVDLTMEEREYIEELEKEYREATNKQ